jgi:hypothetical protein
MITIFKYPVQMTEDFTVRLPAGAKVIHVDVQRGQPQMWVRVDTDQPERHQAFGVFGTGHDMSKHPVAAAPHLGTFMLENLVFHLFGGIYA